MNSSLAVFSLLQKQHLVTFYYFPHEVSAKVAFVRELTVLAEVQAQPVYNAF